MTSLNGDIFVMRNGRSTSQVSIYNYPEHLNPFYEDEQHKRLRFWKLNKLGSNGERRNSFSLGGLKDVWGFKSLRLKKKSSTLGINKTSESPPPLRRDLQYSAANNLSLPHTQMRYSSPAESFQRNAVYRSSLQNVSSSTSKEAGSPRLDFNRNNQYRSMHVPSTRTQHRPAPPVPQPRRYVYGGSVTPQPLRNNEHSADASGEVLKHGSSQISVASTNPFETDDDDEENNEDISLAGDIDGMITSTPNKRLHRKKRRAPAPPSVAVHKSNASSSIRSTNDSSLQSSQEGSNQQPLPELRIEESLSIANLTAEIENFVKTTNEDDDIDRSIASKKTTTTEIQANGDTPKQNDTRNSNTSNTTETTPLSVSSTTKTLTTITATVESQNIDAGARQECQVTVETHEAPKPKPARRPNRSTTETEVGQMECIHIHLDSPRATPERTEPSRVTSFRTERNRSPEPERTSITTKTSFTLSTPPATRRDSANGGSRKNSLKNTTVTLQTTEPLKFPETEELKITEDTSRQSKSPKSPNGVKPTIPTKPHLAEIHKPARGIIVGEARTKSRNETAKELQNPPISPKPPVRHSQTNVVNVETKSSASSSEETPKQQVMETQQNASQPPELPPLDIDEATAAAAPSLMITESNEDLLEPATQQQQETHSEIIISSNSNNHSATVTNTPQTPTALREEVLESLYRPKPTSSYMEWKKSSLAPLEPNVPPEKRKSVKDIIESINRSQRLLNAAAHKDPANLCIGEAINGGTPLSQRKFNEPYAMEQNLEVNQRSIREISNSGANGVDATQEDSSKIMNGSVAAEDPQKLNNDEIFKKCTVKKEMYDFREQSPTSSNLDWNPVPKPKRNMNLSDH